MTTKQRTPRKLAKFVLGVLSALLMGLLGNLATPGAALADFGELPPAPPPEAHDDSAATYENTPVRFGLLDNDTGYYLKLTAKGSVSHGKLTCGEKGVCFYVPKRGYTGPDSFPYTITDSEGQRSSAFVDLFVKSDTVAPKVSLTIEQNSIRSASDGSTTGTLSISASDAGSGVQNMSIANEDKVFSP